LPWALALAALAVPAPDGRAQSPGRPPAAKAGGAQAPHWLRSAVKGRPVPEAVEMLLAIAQGSQMGPGEGWFHPGQGRYGWKWLAARFDANGDGKIDRREFCGPAGLFDRLDRDGDGVLTPADFDWSEKSPLARAAALADPWFYLLDANSNGRVSRAEWDAFFARASRGKGYLTREDLRAALRPPRPARQDPAASAGPSVAVLLKGLLFGELGSFREGPRVGQPAPDFALKTADGKRTVRLSQYRGKRPVVLVFGSFT
jgi:hypothetical protein